MEQLIAEDSAIVTPEELPVSPPCYIPLKEPLYHNMLIQAPDGTAICRAGPKKINWYLSRDLAEVISKEPMIIRLKFAPGGRGDADCDYQMSEKENICVCCGRDDHNTKHHIVEYEYRKHLPESYKSHNSYDVVILCGACHARYEKVAMQVKAGFSKKYNAPLNGTGAYLDKEKMGIRKAASALVSFKSVMPAARIEDLEKSIKAYLKKDEFTEEDLKELVDLDPFIKTSEYRSHGELVVSHLNTPALQEEFIKFWRSHFIETMSPKFLGQKWAVERRVSEFDESKGMTKSRDS